MKSLTHTTPNQISLEEVLTECQLIADRLRKDTNIDESRRIQLSAYLEQLKEFELGRFLIKNRGALSGHWTYYIILGFTTSPSLHPLEEAMVMKAPGILATRERFHIFQFLLQKNIQSNTVTCSIPCGVMADLLTLNLPETVENVHFVGIDLDQVSLDLAKDMAEQKKKTQSCRFFKEDAWDLGRNHPEEFDLLTTNGLNIYQPNDEQVIDLYKAFYAALKPGGKLIGSSLSKPEEWDLSKIDAVALDLQRAIFIQILQATWSNPRTAAYTTQQLQQAGFHDVDIFWDKAHMFYSFEASRPKI